MLPEKLTLNTSNFLQEAAIMTKMRHPNVIRLYGVVLDTKAVMLVWLPTLHLLITIVFIGVRIGAMRLPFGMLAMSGAEGTFSDNYTVRFRLANCSWNELLGLSAINS